MLEAMEDVPLTAGWAILAELHNCARLIWVCVSSLATIWEIFIRIVSQCDREDWSFWTSTDPGRDVPSEGVGLEKLKAKKTGQRRWNSLPRRCRSWLNVCVHNTHQLQPEHSRLIGCHAISFYCSHLEGIDSRYHVRIIRWVLHIVDLRIST